MTTLTPEQKLAALIAAGWTYHSNMAGTTAWQANAVYQGSTNFGQLPETPEALEVYRKASRPVREWDDEDRICYYLMNAQRLQERPNIDRTVACLLALKGYADPAKVREVVEAAREWLPSSAPTASRRLVDAICNLKPTIIE